MRRTFLTLRDQRRAIAIELGLHRDLLGNKIGRAHV